MKTSLTFKTAAVALAVTTLTFATPASAQFNNNGSGQLLGALIGGTAGAALGDGIAPRGRSTEYGIAGGLIGGIAGAAIAGNNSRSNQYRGGSYNGGGYYNGGTTYYQQPRVVYSQPVYSQPVYSRPVYSSPYYCLLYTSPSPRDRG